MKSLANVNPPTFLGHMNNSCELAACTRRWTQSSSIHRLIPQKCPIYLDVPWSLGIMNTQFANLVMPRVYISLVQEPGYEARVYMHNTFRYLLNIKISIHSAGRKSILQIKHARNHQRKHVRYQFIGLLRSQLEFRRHKKSHQKSRDPVFNTPHLMKAVEYFTSLLYLH